MDVFVRAELPADDPAVASVLSAAFASGDQGVAAEALLVNRLRADPDAWLARLSLVAVEDGRVVGYVLGSRILVGGAPAVALAPLAVVPTRQGRGIGQQLTRRLIGEARTAGETLIVVLGDPEYYCRFGFRAAEDLGIVGPYHGPAFQALPLAADAPVGPAEYPAAFDGI